MREDELKKQETIEEKLDFTEDARMKYLCIKCDGYHYIDSDIGRKHKQYIVKKTQVDPYKNLIQKKASEFEKKFAGTKVEIQSGGSYIPVILTGKRKPHYIEIEGKGWVHQSLIFFPGKKAYKETKRYELKKGEKGFWEI